MSVDSHGVLRNDTVPLLVSPDGSSNMQNSSVISPPEDDIDTTEIQKIPWINKVWYIRTMEYYSVIKKEQDNAIAATWIYFRACHTE